MTGIKIGSATFKSDKAACLGLDPNLFFPERGASVDAAKRVCMSCPVRAECLEFALVEVVKHGIFGGTSEHERRRLRRERGISETRPRPPCGTTAGYSAHGRYREDACQACRDALAVYQLHRRAENEEDEHGDTCRCYECQRIADRRRYLRVVS